jgi:serine protease Do
MTVGIISALGRSLPVDTQTSGTASYTIPDVIQTDAPINPGNSGGVLLNDRGEVIGVTSAIESTSGNNAGIGFAIPVDIVQRIVPELIKSGAYQHPWLGISGVTLSSAMAKAMDLPENQRGIMIGTVTPGSPAEKAGLMGSEKQVQIDGMDATVGGDVIVAVDGQTIKRFDDLVSYLFAQGAVGQTIKLDVLRDGKPKTLEVVLAARPNALEQASTESNPAAPRKTVGSAWLGIYGLDLNQEIAKEMNLDAQQQGVLVEEILPGSPAETAGLKGSDKTVTLGNQTVAVGGDIITAFNSTTINTLKELKAAISKAAPGEKVEFTILRGGQTLTIQVTLAEAPAN